MNKLISLVFLIILTNSLVSAQSVNLNIDSLKREQEMKRQFAQNEYAVIDEAIMKIKSSKLSDDEINKIFQPYLKEYKLANYQSFISKYDSLRTRDEQILDSLDLQILEIERLYKSIKNERAIKKDIESSIDSLEQENKHLKASMQNYLAELELLKTNSAKPQDSLVNWQIQKENPAYGLTLGYSLPKAQLQAIVGDSFTPRVDANGNGNLMLFIATAKKYNLNSASCNNLKIAHILIPLENSLNNPLIISDGNQELNELFKTYNFKLETGKIELLVEYKGDSIFTKAEILTKEGNICITASFANNPGSPKTIPAAKISAAAHPKSFFIGDESYRGIPIPSVIIESKGKNWISQLNLPSKPDKVWLNIDFTWDFVFTKE